MNQRLEAAFPGLRTTPYQITSPADPCYNCIAWAAGGSTEWWWPLEQHRRTFWPAGISREVSLTAFVAAFGALGYAAGSNESVEPGFEKVALFADPDGIPTHASRQLPTGAWASKLGQAEDIAHELRALEGEVYGAVAVILRRPIQTR